MAGRLLIKVFFVLPFISTGFAQPPRENYSEIYSTDYQRAVQFLVKENRLDSIILYHGLNPREVTAIAFPELIRYNSIQDQIETFALESLYIRYGKNYADFSVGKFQIKPSFAECIEIDFIKSFGYKNLSTEYKIDAIDTVQNPENRLKRLKRIKKEIGMANYLCMFWKVMTEKYPSWKSEEEKIKFFACAYNSGYRKSKKELEPHISKKFFHTGLSITSKKYCYSDISWYYFQHP